MNLDFKKELDYWGGGLAILLLYIPVRLVGFILQRKHRLDQPRHVAFVKMLGGGSLLMLLPTLQALREKYPRTRFSLVCSSAIQGFAEAYDVFDEVRVIQDKSFVSLIKTSIETLLWLFQNVDTTVDLEVHSRLTTVFTTVSLATNRVGFVDQNSLWRQRIYTHAIYVNPFNAIYDYYDAVAFLFGVTSIEVQKSQDQYVEKIKNLPRLPIQQKVVPQKYYAIGVGCSDLALERMIPVKDWAAIINETAQDYPDLQFVFLGAKRDSHTVHQILMEVDSAVRMRCTDLCGELKLQESVKLLLSAFCFIGIDSALIHFARFLRTPSVSFWGPTKPEALLRPFCVKDLQLYKAIACSPCVHLTEFPPCKGQNICNNHRESFGNIREFLVNIETVATRTPQTRRSDIWIYYPSSQIPRRTQLEVHYT